MEPTKTVVDCNLTIPEELRVTHAVPLDDAELEQHARDQAAAPALAKAMRRAERDGLLAASDWTQLPDTLTPAKTKAWAAYRQALRDHALDAAAFPKAPR
jgi:Phage tail assembly chaperone protein